MKYELTNIPVLAAFEARPDCVLCHLEDRLEQQYTDFFLGNSVMVPEMRVEVNRAGFCGRHLRLLLAGKNKLGYSLLLQTHLSEQQKHINGRSTGTDKAKVTPFSKKTREIRSAVTELADHIAAGAATCLLCDRLEHTLTNYRYTIVKLHESREDFREVFAHSSGICMRHLPGLLRMSAEQLKGEQLRAFAVAAITAQSQRAARIAAGLEGFAEKFDYRNTAPMEEEERLSLARAVRFLGADDV